MAAPRSARDVPACGIIENNLLDLILLGPPFRCDGLVSAGEMVEVGHGGGRGADTRGPITTITPLVVTITCAFTPNGENEPRGAVYRSMHVDRARPLLPASRRHARRARRPARRFLAEVADRFRASSLRQPMARPSGRSEPVSTATTSPAGRPQGVAHRLQDLRDVPHQSWHEGASSAHSPLLALTSP